MDPLAALVAEQAARRASRLRRRLAFFLVAPLPLFGVFLLLVVAGMTGAASDDEARRNADGLCAQFGGSDGQSGSPSTRGRASPSRSTVPAVAASPSPSSGATGQVPTMDGRPLSDEQRSVAQTIIATGREMNVPQQGIIIALMTASQESRLQNLQGGDRDSVGAFQQRPSQGWGTVEQLTDVHYAAGKFYSALLHTAGWQDMSLNDAAQAVQRSGFPDAYGQWQSLAVQLVGSAGGGDPIPAGCDITVHGGGDEPAPDGVVGAILDVLKSKLGTPYAFGGGTPTGPSVGRGGYVGWDCSSYMQMGVYQGTGGKVLLPRTSQAQGAAFAQYAVPVSQMQPGDLIFEEGSSPADAGHVAMAVGGGKMIEEPHTGASARIRDIDDGGVIGVIRLPLAKLMGQGAG